jgi:hypothetical protein
MDAETFDKFAAVLLAQFAREYPGTDVFIAAFPPGSFHGLAGPHTATTLPAEMQSVVLHKLADSSSRLQKVGAVINITVKK